MYKYFTMSNEEAYEMMCSGDIVNATQALFKGKNYAKEKMTSSPFALKLKNNPSGRFFVRHSRGVSQFLPINMPYKIDATAMIGVFETEQRIEAFDGSKIIPIEYFEIEEWSGYLPEDVEQKIKKQILLKRL